MPKSPMRGTSGACGTCLAADRELSALRLTPQLLNVCVGLALSQNDRICYECRARLNNFVLFRSRVLRAQTLLSQFTRSQCLSTLTQTVISPDDTICVDGDSIQVRLESSDSELQELIAEPLVDLKEIKADGSKIADDDYDTKLELVSEANETFEAKPRKEQIDFVVRPIDRSEVLAYYERERDKERYQRAPYKCHPCALPFLSEQKLRSHNTLHGEKRGHLKCEVCEQRFRDDAALKLHTDFHYKSYSCRECDRTDCSYYKMAEHYKNCHLTKLQLCRGCPARFMSKRELKNHTRTAHKRRRQHTCGTCARHFATRDSLLRHQRMQHTDVPELECDVCHKRYRGRTYLSVHMRNVHGAPRGPPEEAYCAECDMQFRDPQQYKQHLKSTRRHVAPGDYQFECAHCGKRFVGKYNLRTHIRLLHLHVTPYKCDICGQCFPTSSYLTVHKRSKHGLNPRPRIHRCHLCEKAFTLRKSLEEHLNTHLGVRPYECKICGATFAYKAALYNHNRLVHKTSKGDGGNT